MPVVARQHLVGVAQHRGAVVRAGQQVDQCVADRRARPGSRRSARRARRSRARPACRARPVGHRRPAPRAASGRSLRTRTGTRRPSPASRHRAACPRRHTTAPTPARQSPPGTWRSAAVTSWGGYVRFSPTISSRLPGTCGATRRTNASIRRSTWRRRKIEPTKSTSGSRVASRAIDDARLRPSGTTVMRSRGDAEMPHDLVAGELRVGEHDACASRRPGGQRPSSAPFARAEPLGVGGERDVVNRQRDRAGRRERRAVARREQHVRAIARQMRAPASTVPSACRPNRGRP